MQQQRLHEITSAFAGKRIVVCGDFFLDRYLWIDAQRAEISVETGLTANQVTSQTCAPGAAGTVVANLTALGAQVICVGVVGNDGDGFMLRQGLEALGADDSLLITTPDRPTPTYTKPTVRNDDGSLRELERLDIRSRDPIPAHISQQITQSLLTLADTCDAMVFADQMPEAGCGVIDAHIHAAIAQIAQSHPQLIMLADSRQRIAVFSHVIVKPNLHEACSACEIDETTENAQSAAAMLSTRTGCPSVVTLGGDGVLVYANGISETIAALPVDGPIDIVGAGDSVMAALTMSLVSGASLAEAAQIAMLVAGVTIRKLGTTGSASIHEIQLLYQKYF
jgi:rfaE bifunctional protein kinase chain/domain